jgi:hypothetical protein
VGVLCDNAYVNRQPDWYNKVKATSSKKKTKNISRFLLRCGGVMMMGRNLDDNNKGSTSMNPNNIHDNNSSNNMNLSSTSLEHKLKQLRDESYKHGQILTQKLASSQSGHNLLHIGTSLSTLPSDLSELNTHLQPIVSVTEQQEKKQMQMVEHIIEQYDTIQSIQRRILYTDHLSILYNDLLIAEQIIQRSKQQHQPQQQPKQQQSIQPGQDDSNENQNMSSKEQGVLSLCFSFDVKIIIKTHTQNQKMKWMILLPWNVLPILPYHC